jgi:hypothetical protein
MRYGGFRQKVPSQQSRVAPHDLAYRGQSAAAASGDVCGAIEARLGALIIDRDSLNEVDDRSEKEGASTQAAQYMTDREGNRYRLKCNADRPNVTFHEVFAAQMLNVMGFSGVPAARFVSDYTDKEDRSAGEVWIASPQVEGFTDLGPFLVGSGKQYVSENQKTAYQQHLDAYHAAQGRARQILSGEGPAAQLMKGYRKGGVSELDETQHAALQPLRDEYRAGLQAQERMLALLPPQFHDALLRAFYTSEVVGNWDFLNHDRANTGFSIQGGMVRSHTVDFGNSGPIGFGGKTKPASIATARQPARKDDPYLRATTYPHETLSMADVETRAVSRTYGAVGQIPRSAVSAHILAPAIVQERERNSVDEPIDTAPPQALEVAWHLKSLPSVLVRQFAAAFFDKGSNHADPAIRALFSPQTTGFANSEALAEEYEARVKDIVDRAQKGGQLRRWVTRNPDLAAEISQAVRELTSAKLDHEGRVVRDGFKKIP